MNRLSSEPTVIVMPSGRFGLTSSARSLAAVATASVLAPDWRTMPMPTDSAPLAWKLL
jgi:hypothetical protein